MAQPTRRVTVLIALALALTAGVVRASFTDDFYANVLHRGIAYADAGNDLAAVKELRIAAFGLVEDVPKFELAESYLAVVAHRLKRDDEARHSLQRLVAAERVERHYASLPLPKDMRASVEAVALSLLTADQLAILHNVAAAPGHPSPQPGPAPAQPEKALPQPVVPAPRQVTDPQAMPALPQPQPVKPSPPPTQQPTPRSAAQPVTSTPLPPTPTPQQVPTRVEPELSRPSPQIVSPKPAADRTSTTSSTTTTSSNGGHALLPRADAATVPPAVKDGLTAAEQALDRGDLPAARDQYARLVEANPLDRASALRIAEGLYQTGDYRNAVRSYQRLGAFREGESQQGYYFAVSLYETGDYRAAKRELAAALPNLKQTAEVQRNRAKIEGAID